MRLAPSHLVGIVHRDAARAVGRLLPLVDHAHPETHLSDHGVLAGSGWSLPRNMMKNCGVGGVDAVAAPRHADDAALEGYAGEFCFRLGYFERGAVISGRRKRLGH